MRQIHIIVSCANKKRQPSETWLRCIPDADVERRAQLWWEKLCRASDSASGDALVEARNLYTGNYWSIAKQLRDLPDKNQVETKLWVISAGYGLVSANDSLVPYSATFTKGDADSVTRNAKDSRTAGAIWWNKLATLSLPKSAHSKSPSPRSLAELIRRCSNAHFLVVASSHYLAAIQSDLVRGIGYLDDRSRLLIISSKSGAIVDALIPHLVFTDARLVCDPTCLADCDVHLLGRSVRGSIGVALARKFMSDFLNRGFSCSQINTEIKNALTKNPNLFAHQRTPMSDADLRLFIDRECRISTSTSATGLLRKLRDDGYGCEQKRFKHLYQQVIEAKS